MRASLEKEQLSLPDKPVQLSLIADAVVGGIDLIGVHVYLNRDQFIVLHRPEFIVQECPVVLTPGQIIEQASGHAIVLVHFDILGLDQLANLRIADIGALRADAAAGHLFMLLHAEEGQHRRAQLRAGGEGGGSQTGCGQDGGQRSGQDPAGRDACVILFGLLHNTLL